MLTFFLLKSSIVSLTQSYSNKHWRKEERHTGWIRVNKQKELDRPRGQEGGIKEELAAEKGIKREIRKARLSVIWKTLAHCSNPHWKVKTFSGEAGRWSLLQGHIALCCDVYDSKVNKKNYKTFIHAPVRLWAHWRDQVSLGPNTVPGKQAVVHVHWLVE